MRIVDKINKCGITKAYEDIPSELLAFTPGCQVQPAPYIDSAGYKFFFFKKFSQGEDIDFPNGGFILRGYNGVKYAFDLDQVILYREKKIILSYEDKVVNTCGFVKRDGTKCLMKSKVGFCRFHR